MAIRRYNNTSLTQTLTAGVSDTDVVLPVGDTASYPVTPFTLVLERQTPDQEVVLCTGKTATAFTVTRGFDGTTAIAHDAGSSVEHAVAALDYAEANAHVNDGAHLYTSTVDAKGDLLVGTGDNAVGRLGVGANGYNLIPDSGQASGFRYEQSRGTIVCTSTTRPTAGLYDGIRIFETDTKLLYLRVGGVWMPEPGQLLGHTKYVGTSAYVGGMVQRMTLNFTMPTLAAGRRVRVTAGCYFYNLAAATSGQLYSYGIIVKYTGYGIGGAIWSGYILTATAIGMPYTHATIDNNDVPAGPTTVGYNTLIVNASNAQLSHAMVGAADAPAFLEAMII